MPVMRALVGAGITPNHVTIVAIVMSCLTGLAIWLQPEARWPLALLPAVLFLRMALNAIDGMMARTLNMSSRLGAVLNEVGDVVSDAALYAPLACVPAFHPVFVVAIVIVAVMTEMTGVVGVQIGASRRYDGPMGKSDRAFVFGALALLLVLGVQPGTWLDAVLIIVLVLSIVTVFNRAAKALAEARR